MTRAAGGTKMKLMACAGIQNTQLVLNVGTNFCLHSSNKSFLPSRKLMAANNNDGEHRVTMFYADPVGTRKLKSKLTDEEDHV